MPTKEPNSNSKVFATEIENCNYRNPFLKFVDNYFFKYLIFETEYNGIKYAKGIDHFLIPSSITLCNLEVSQDFFKHF